jgi:hypothetical protein
LKKGFETSSELQDAVGKYAATAVIKLKNLHAAIGTQSTSGMSTRCRTSEEKEFYFEATY